MHDAADVEAYLKDKGLVLLGPVVSSPNDDLDFYAFVQIEYSADARQIPSAHRLNSISAEAADNEIKIHFVLVQGETEQLDRSLKTVLFGKYPNDIRNSFVALEGKDVDLWIEPKRTLSDELCRELKGTIVQFVELLSLNLRSLKVTHDANIPTPTAIMRVLRTISPASLEAIGSALKEKGFVVPNEVWLSHTLDRLRKAGRLVRKSNQEYILSYKGLTVLGTTKGRRSPDIERALALARQRR